MNKQVISFTANEQALTRTGECRYSSNKVSYIEAHFELGANWDGFDSVRAVWFTDFVSGISTVLDSDGVCIVPSEVLRRKAKVNVNLVGSISVDGELTDRLTSYPVVALCVDADAKVDGTETAPITPSQFEQFVAAVRELVESVKDIDHIELNADYTLTIYYSDGTSYTTDSIRGEQGEDGNGIESAVLNADYTLTLNFTDGTSYTTTSIRGEQGPQGEPGVVPWDDILPTDTASGQIASFPDGTDLLGAKSVLVELEPIQEGTGTPSPSNIRPISGRTECVTEVSGANLFDEANAVIYRRYFLDEGDNNYSWYSSSDSGSFAFSCEPNTTYTVSCDNSAITIFRVGYINVDPSELESSDAPRINGVVKKTARSDILY